MGLISGTVVFFLVWWITLFAVLPIGIRPDAEGDLASGGWRGAPSQTRFWRVVLLNTAVAAVVWLGIDLIVASPWLSFRSGWLALPER